MHVFWSVLAALLVFHFLTSATSWEWDGLFTGLGWIIKWFCLITVFGGGALLLSWGLLNAAGQIILGIIAAITLAIFTPVFRWLKAWQKSGFQYITPPKSVAEKRKELGYDK